MQANVAQRIFQLINFISADLSDTLSIDMLRYNAENDMLLNNFLSKRWSKDLVGKKKIYLQLRLF